MHTKTYAAISAVLTGVAALLAALLISQGAASAHTATVSEAAASTKSTTSTTKPLTYVYVAQPGDSYSKIARKAAQTYSIKSKANLSNSRIMYAETHLTQAAGSPSLIVGQQVTIPEATVKTWVDKAKALSAADAAKWDTYIVGVNFNTDHVGQK